VLPGKKRKGEGEREGVQKKRLRGRKLNCDFMCIIIIPSQRGTFWGLGLENTKKACRNTNRKFPPGGNSRAYRAHLQGEKHKAALRGKEKGGNKENMGVQWILSSPRERKSFVHEKAPYLQKGGGGRQGKRSSGVLCRGGE